MACSDFIATRERMAVRSPIASSIGSSMDSLPDTLSLRHVSPAELPSQDVSRGDISPTNAPGSVRVRRHNPYHVITAPTSGSQFHVRGGSDRSDSSDTATKSKMARDDEFRLPPPMMAILLVEPSVVMPQQMLEAARRDLEHAVHAEVAALQFNVAIRGDAEFAAFDGPIAAAPGLGVAQHSVSCIRVAQAARAAAGNAYVHIIDRAYKGAFHDFATDVGYVSMVYTKARIEQYGVAAVVAPNDTRIMRRADAGRRSPRLSTDSDFCLDAAMLAAQGMLVRFIAFDRVAVITASKRGLLGQVTMEDAQHLIQVHGDLAPKSKLGGCLGELKNEFHRCFPAFRQCFSVRITHLALFLAIGRLREAAGDVRSPSVSRIDRQRYMAARAAFAMGSPACDHP